MNLGFLLVLAISIPLLLIVALLAFVRGIPWFAAHPRGFGVLALLVAMSHLGYGAWQVRSAETTEGIVQILVGATWAVLGAYHWFRVPPQEVD
jgi:hypothetical protein